MQQTKVRQRLHVVKHPFNISFVFCWRRAVQSRWLTSIFFSFWVVGWLLLFLTFQSSYSPSTQSLKQNKTWHRQNDLFYYAYFSHNTAGKGKGKDGMSAYQTFGICLLWVPNLSKREISYERSFPLKELYRTSVFCRKMVVYVSGHYL